MNKLREKDKITSLELLEQINIFRVKENRSELQHYDLLKIIRDEFEEEITDGKISASEYKDKTGRKLPMYILTFNQAKQVLTRESKTVRKAVFKYIDELEKKYLTAVKILNNKNSPEWLEIRQGSKENNKSFRDTLKALEDYATARGSRKATLIYSNYSKLINKLSGTDDTRDSLSPYKLHLIEQLENIIKKEINKGMAELKDHKEIYRKCKIKSTEFISYLN